jgi:hypothetical protein
MRPFDQGIAAGRGAGQIPHGGDPDRTRDGAAHAADADRGGSSARADMSKRRSVGDT